MVESTISGGAAADLLTTSAASWLLAVGVGCALRASWRSRPTTSTLTTTFCSTSYAAPALLGVGPGSAARGGPRAGHPPGGPSPGDWSGSLLHHDARPTFSNSSPTTKRAVHESDHGTHKLQRDDRPRYDFGATSSASYFSRPAAKPAAERSNGRGGSLLRK